MTDDLIGSSTEKGTDAIVVLRMQGEDTLIVLTLRVNTNVRETTMQSPGTRRADYWLHFCTLGIHNRYVQNV